MRRRIGAFSGASYKFRWSETAGNCVTQLRDGGKRQKTFAKGLPERDLLRPLRLKILIVDIVAKHLTLGSRMFTVRLDMNAEIRIMLRIIETVMPLESVDLGFADRGNLALVRVKRRETFGYRPTAAARSEGFDQILRFLQLFCNSALRYQ